VGGLGGARSPPSNVTAAVFHVDAFTDQRFGGNPAAVCLLPAAADAAWMQAVAREMNQPATAFAWPCGASVPRAAGPTFTLRWFTPTVELQFCGHGTLATASVLWDTGALAPTASARFETPSGTFGATRDGEWIELDLPSEPAEPAAPPPGLLDALGVSATWVGRNRLDYLVEVDAEATVRRMAPDLARLREVPTRGVMVTAAAATPPYDFVSRFFAPSVGLAEDHVTGSAHCCLGPFWAARLARDRLRAWQASPRGGELRVTVDGSRVRLGGRVVTVARGSLTG